MPRKIKFKEGAEIEPCPHCGNKTEFTFYSSQFAEDCCEVWAECKCGFEPKDARFEDVMGGCDDDNCRFAIHCWNDSIAHMREQKAKDTQGDQTYPHT